MSDIHILDGTRSQAGVILKRYAFHYAVPAEHQVEAAAQDPALVGFESAVPDIAQAELDAIKAGTVVEITITLPYHHTEDGASVLARVRAKRTERQTRAINAYRARYHHYLETYAGS
jgi:hypothetical protein